MPRLIRLAKWGIAALCVAVLLVAAILVFLPSEKYRQIAESAITSALGRSTTMQALNVEFGTLVRISASGIRVANAPWAKSPSMLDLQQLSLDIRLLSLLAGRLQGSVRINGAQVEVEQDSTGTNNWALFPATPGGDSSSTDNHFSVPDFELLEIVKKDEKGASKAKSNSKKSG